ncbi:MAG: AMP-binding protein [Holophaga sp.]|nr:AMP-binding protein [Holophaga sp.]
MSFLPLGQLVGEAREPNHPVALELNPGTGPVLRTWAQFAAAAAGVAERSRRAGGQRWILACPEAWDFAAGLFGLLQAGRTVVLPPNFLPETLRRLEREADGVLWELGEALPPAPAALTGSVEFWTSGSTGEPKGVPRSMAQLEAEVVMLERSFGHLLPAGPMAGTVPHHHIYGCLFRILWPLAAGRPFLCEPAGDPAGFLRALSQPAPVALVASPAHLSRLPQLLDLDALAVPPGVVFCSGGPLRAEDAALWSRRVPAGVVEIYGSTESGGIAWRIQGPDPDSAHWTPFADVTVAFQGAALVVTSFRAGPGPLRMEDAAEPVAGGRFRLLGRLDRIIKLEEKRISLPELEQALEAHPWVARAAVVLLEGPRPTLGAVVVLNPGAPAERGLLVRTLRAHLALRFDGPALPRRWRFPEQLPYDGRGKLTPQALGRLFLAPPGSCPTPP